MTHLSVKTFHDLMNGQPYAEIRCMYSNNLVRKLSQAAGFVQIDALAPPIVSVPLNTPITLRPWVMDRGNLLFQHPDFPNGAKLCGEFDKISFANGDTFQIASD